MSLESTVAGLTAQAGLLLDLPQNIANAGVAQINAVGNAYQSRLNSLSVDVYVNSITGNDANPGTEALPLKTINKATTMCARGGRLMVRLAADHNMTEDVSWADGWMTITSVGARKVLTFDREIEVIGATSYRACKGFNLSNCTIDMSNVNVVQPTCDGAYAALPVSNRSSIFRANNYSATSLFTVKLRSMELNLPVAATPAQAYGPLIQPLAGLVGLHISSVTLAAAAYLGRLLSGVEATAGTATTTLPWLITNAANV